MHAAPDTHYFRYLHVARIARMMKHGIVLFCIACLTSGLERYKVTAAAIALIGLAQYGAIRPFQSQSLQRAAGKSMQMSRHDGSTRGSGASISESHN